MSDLAVKQRSAGMPRAVLLCGAALIAFAIASASVARVSGLGTLRNPTANVVKSLALRFEDQADGSVLVRDAGDGALIYSIAPGTNGFMRATLRGLARERRRTDVGEEQPFQLTYWDDGRLSLDDKATGRKVALEAFGPTNAQAFSRLFLARGDGR